LSDIKPFVAIGEILKDNGHQVIYAFPEQFREVALSSELEFKSLGSKFIELLESEDGKAAMGGATGFKKVFGTIRLAFNQSWDNKELLINQKEIIDKVQPDKIIYNGKAIYPILLKFNFMICY
jgi:UDP:flavonoid glycosyltransferase YjiC (YdhE family)